MLASCRGMRQKITVSSKYVFSKCLVGRKIPQNAHGFIDGPHLLSLSITDTSSESLELMYVFNLKEENY